MKWVCGRRWVYTGPLWVWLCTTVFGECHTFEGMTVYGTLRRSPFSLGKPWCRYDGLWFDLTIFATNDLGKIRIAWMIYPVKPWYGPQCTGCTCMCVLCVAWCLGNLVMYIYCIKELLYYIFSHCVMCSSPCVTVACRPPCRRDPLSVLFPQVSTS